MDSLECYLKKVMQEANLAPKDHKRVKEELQDHLYAILESNNTKNLTEKEVLQMIEKEFGNPKVLGEEIANAKGKFLTYCKKNFFNWKSWALAAVVAVVIYATFLPLKVSSNKLSPIISKGARCFAWRWSSNFSPGDLVVYKNKKRYVFGLVEKKQNNILYLSLGDRGKKTIAKNFIVGKIVLQTR